MVAGGRRRFLADRAPLLGASIARAQAHRRMDVGRALARLSHRSMATIAQSHISRVRDGGSKDGYSRTDATKPLESLMWRRTACPPGTDAIRRESSMRPSTSRLSSGGGFSTVFGCLRRFGSASLDRRKIGPKPAKPAQE